MCLQNLLAYSTKNCCKRDNAFANHHLYLASCQCSSEICTTQREIIQISSANIFPRKDDDMIHLEITCNISLFSIEKRTTSIRKIIFNSNQWSVTKIISYKQMIANSLRNVSIL